MSRPARLSQVAAEGILLAGGACAILLQVANPDVGRAIARHSDFATRPMHRLDATLSYVYAVVFGTPADLERMTRHVDAAHDPVTRATDPELQLWVAATLYDTALRITRRIGGPLDAASEAEIYAGYAALGTSLQMPAELWPPTPAAFERWWSAEVAALDVTPEARRIADELLHTRGIPWWLRLGMPLARLVTADLLPPSVRAAYGLRWDARRQRRADTAWRVVAAVYPRLPQRVRYWPRDHYLRRLRTAAG